MLRTMAALAVVMPSQGVVAEELGTTSRVYPLPDSIGSLTVTQAQEQCDAQAAKLIKGTLSAEKTREVLAICSLAGADYKKTLAFSKLRQNNGDLYFPELAAGYNREIREAKGFLSKQQTSAPLMLVVSTGKNPRLNAIEVQTTKSGKYQLATTSALVVVGQREGDRTTPGRHLILNVYKPRADEEYAQPNFFYPFFPIQDAAGRIDGLQSFHSYKKLPANQLAAQYAETGSLGCVRVGVKTIEWLKENTDIGTQVVVGNFNPNIFPPLPQSQR